MPSLIRFLVIIGVLAALIYIGMLALVAFVEPQPREMTQIIPPSRLNK
ncbi:MAG TPA: oxidoreductase [Methylocella sp.]|nr:oxidoreductase [Methylocella sp.]